MSKSPTTTPRSLPSWLRGVAVTASGLAAAGAVVLTAGLAAAPAPADPPTPCSQWLPGARPNCLDVQIPSDVASPPEVTGQIPPNTPRFASPGPEISIQPSQIPLSRVPAVPPDPGPPKWLDPTIDPITGNETCPEGYYYVPAWGPGACGLAGTQG